MLFTQDASRRSSILSQNINKNARDFLKNVRLLSRWSYMSQVKEKSTSEVRPFHHRVSPVPLHGHPPDGRLLQLDDDLQVADEWFCESHLVNQRSTLRELLLIYALHLHHIFIDRRNSDFPRPYGHLVQVASHPSGEELEEYIR